MTDKFKFTEEMRIKFAEAEFDSVKEASFLYDENHLPHIVAVDSNGATHCLPIYDTHDDLQRIIDGLDGCDFIKYADKLYGIVGGAPDDMLELKAAVAQKQEAICRAKGWIK